MCIGRPFTLKSPSQRSSLGSPAGKFIEFSEIFIPEKENLFNRQEEEGKPDNL